MAPASTSSPPPSPTPASPLPASPSPGIAPKPASSPPASISPTSSPPPSFKPKSPSSSPTPFHRPALDNLTSPRRRPRNSTPHHRRLHHPRHRRRLRAAHRYFHVHRRSHPKVAHPEPARPLRRQPHSRLYPRSHPMIPRFQRILFWILAGGSLVMVLFPSCAVATRRTNASPPSSTPTPSPHPPPPPPKTSLSTSPTTAKAPSPPAQRSIALPQGAHHARAPSPARPAPRRVRPSPSPPHPLQSGSAIQDVFLLSTSTTNPPAFSSLDTQSTGQLAIINLKDSFVANHPSGIEVETLTLQSIIGTLHTAFPDITPHSLPPSMASPHDTPSPATPTLPSAPTPPSTPPSHPEPPT